MKKYNIIVNGTAYAVEVEEVGASTTAAPGAAPTAAPAPSAALAPAAAAAPAAPAAAPAPASAPSAGAKTGECLMPGTILDIKVKPGDTVAVGQVLLILEAMKMENEITSPSAGIIDSIMVNRGASANAGDILLSIK